MRTLDRTVPAPEGLGTEVIGVPAGSDLDLRLRLEAVMDGVLVTGSVAAHAAGECVRCLAEAERDLHVELTELFAYPDRLPGGLADEDDDVRQLEDDRIDIEPALRDAVVLALPFQPVCRDDCPGLCVECGARLADDPAHHHDDAADARWAALAGILADGGDAADGAGRNDRNDRNPDEKET